MQQQLGEASTASLPRGEPRRSKLITRGRPQTGRSGRISPAGPRRGGVPTLVQRNRVDSADCTCMLHGNSDVPSLSVSDARELEMGKWNFGRIVSAVRGEMGIGLVFPGNWRGLEREGMFLIVVYEG